MKTLLLTTSILAAGCWAMPHAYADRPATPAERQAAGFDDPAIPYMIRDMPAARAQMPRSPMGIPDSKFQTRLGSAFFGRTSDYTFGFAPPPSTGCDSGTERFATAAFDLPQGASIYYLDVFGFDANASDDMLVFLLQVCHDLGSLDPPVVTPTGHHHDQRRSRQCAGDAGFQRRAHRGQPLYLPLHGAREPGLPRRCLHHQHRPRQGPHPVHPCRQLREHAT